MAYHMFPQLSWNFPGCLWQPLHRKQKLMYAGRKLLMVVRLTSFTSLAFTVLTLVFLPQVSGVIYSLSFNTWESYDFLIYAYFLRVVTMHFSLMFKNRGLAFYMMVTITLNIVCHHHHNQPRNNNVHSFSHSMQFSFNYSKLTLVRAMWSRIWPGIASSGVSFFVERNSDLLKCI